MHKVYVRQDTKIGDEVPILNRTTPSLVSPDRLNVPPGYSADEYEYMINRKFQISRTPKEYFSGTLGHISRPFQAFGQTGPIPKVIGGKLNLTERGGDRFPFQNIIDPPVFGKGRKPDIGLAVYPDSIITNFSGARLTSSKRHHVLNPRTI